MHQTIFSHAHLPIHTSVFFFLSFYFFDFLTLSQAAEEDIKLEFLTVEMEAERWGLRARMTDGPVTITTVTRVSSSSLTHTAFVMSAYVILSCSAFEYFFFCWHRTKRGGGEAE
jgi:hypothetical protein